MAITPDMVMGAHSQDAIYLPSPGAAVSNVSYLSQRFYKSDLTANSNQGRFRFFGWGSSYQVHVNTFRFAFDGTPTQRVKIAEDEYANRRIYLNTSRYLEIWDATNYWQAATQLATGTEYQIALVQDYSAGSGGASRELIYVNKAIDLDKTLTVPSTYAWYVWFGENLGASNPGMSLYFRDLCYYRVGAITETMYQPAVGYAVARADGTLNQWGKSDGGLNYWDHVDEIPASGSDNLYCKAPTTPLSAWEYLSQRATIGLATDDTVLGVVPGWYIGATYDSGTKWAASAGLRQGSNQSWLYHPVPNPGDGLWAGSTIVGVYAKPGGGSWSPSDFDDWQIGMGIQAGVEHNIYARFGAGIAFVGYYNASMALEAPSLPSGAATRTWTAMI